MMGDELILMNATDFIAEGIEALIAAAPAKKGALRLKTPRDPEKLRQYRTKSRAKKAAAKAAAKKPKSKRSAAKAQIVPKSSKRGPQGRREQDKIRNGIKSWGLKVRRKRLELGYTQEQFAAIVGVKQPHICNLEKGTFKAGPMLRERIEKMFFAHVGLKKVRKGAPKA